MMELKTPLYDCHIALGGKVIEFGGYLLPVQYSGLIAEHMAVREACGLFDVSHMGQVILTGADALKNVNNLLTNDYSDLADGQARYGMMCQKNGGIIDDLITYKMRDAKYLIVVNASNREKDFKWIKSHIEGDCEARDVSDEVALLALQGPKADELLKSILTAGSIPEKGYWADFSAEVAGVKAAVSRTGYTGEDGFELYCRAGDAVTLWNAIIAAGEPFNLLPCGLGARDTLRLEASMPLYGHELSEELNPYEAGLGFFVKLQKDSFIGKTALEAAKQNVTRKRVGLKMTGRGIAREGCVVTVDGSHIGTVTSGTHCPYLGYAVAMAYVEAEFATLGQAAEIDVRGRAVTAEIVKTPFYKKA